MTDPKIHEEALELAILIGVQSIEDIKTIYCCITTKQNNYAILQKLPTKNM